MRIPSQFNEDSLYSRVRRAKVSGGTRKPLHDSAQTYRRLFRLGIGLILILVVMRQASQPKLYEPFFGKESAKKTQTSLPTSPLFAASADSARKVAADVTPADATMADATMADARERERLAMEANLFVELMPISDLQVWLARTLRLIRNQEIEKKEPLYSDWIDSLNDVAELDNETRQEWATLLNRIADDAANVSPDSFHDDDRLRMYWIVRAIDNRIQNKVAESGLWQPQDRDAFYRALDEATFDGFPQAPLVGVLPLLQQSEVYHNQVIRFSGRVAKIETHEAAKNEFGIQDYFQLWLRPTDGADRPLIAIVPHVPEEILAIADQNGNVNSDIPVQVVGRCTKRLAYRSSIGADTAPVVIGHLLLPASSESTNAASPSTENLTIKEHAWVLIAACIAGIGLAALAMWTTSVAAKRSRALRAAHESNSAKFLKDLPQ